MLHSTNPSLFTQNTIPRSSEGRSHRNKAQTVIRNCAVLLYTFFCVLLDNKCAGIIAESRGAVTVIDPTSAILTGVDRAPTFQFGGKGAVCFQFQFSATCIESGNKVISIVAIAGGKQVAGTLGFRPRWSAAPACLRTPLGPSDKVMAGIPCLE